MREIHLSKAYAPADIERLEGAFLGEVQSECSVTHRFGPGIYIRELAVKAGSYIIGHAHKHEHMNALLSGRVSVFLEDGSQVEMTGPTTFVAPAGRKMAYVHEDMVWQNIYATTLTDVAELEAELFEPSETFQSLPLLTKDHSEDLMDFLDAITDAGFTPDEVRAISEFEGDQTPFPYGEYKVMVAPSMIEGRGLFATGNIARLEPIAPARLSGLRTPAGRYTNHSKTPNAMMVQAPNGDFYLYAMRNIAGNQGGMIGEEITIDYRETLPMGGN